MNNKEEKLQQFKNKLTEIYSSKSEEILNTHFLDRKKTFRINNLIDNNKNRALQILNEEGFKFKELELSDFYQVIEEPISLSRSKAFLKNLIYIQEYSSAIPVFELNPNASEKILDLCASPGSKTSLIQSLTNNSAEIIAVEKNRNRFFKLKENLKINNVLNVNVFNIDANRLVFAKTEFNNYFDKALVDVPCTTESKLNLNEKDALKEWKLSNAKSISKLQRGLLNSAFKMLKKNGTLIYSTCTYSVEENEEVINWFLKKNSNAKIMDINTESNNSMQGIVEFKNKSFNKDILKTTRILPSEEYTAFYIAKITKL